MGQSKLALMSLNNAFTSSTAAILPSALSRQKRKKLGLANQITLYLLSKGVVNWVKGSGCNQIKYRMRVYVTGRPPVVFPLPRLGSVSNLGNKTHP